MMQSISISAPRRSFLASTSSVRLKLGASGPQVAELQGMLKQLGIYTKNVDGKFGPITDAAVRNFQKANGLTVDGWAGPKTMAALRRATQGGTAPGTGPVAPPTTGGGSPSAKVQSAIDYGKSVIGSPYASVNPFRFGEVPWDGKRHQSVNGSGSWYQYPKGTRVFDCSGFVVSCFKRAGVDLAAKGLTTSGAIHANTNGFLTNISRDQLKAGDLITYRSSKGVGHVVMYLGDGKTLESSGGKGVHIGTVNWDRAQSFRRVPVG
jgi:peptidoglycan DL-endopeptidase LytE